MPAACCHAPQDCWLWRAHLRAARMSPRRFYGAPAGPVQGSPYPADPYAAAPSAYGAQPGSSQWPNSMQGQGAYPGGMDAGSGYPAYPAPAAEGYGSQPSQQQQQGAAESGIPVVSQPTVIPPAVKRQLHERIDDWE